MTEVKDIYEEQEAAEETFRDALSTVDKEGKRIWLYPKRPKGQLTQYRTLVSTVLLAILFTGPFVKIAGQPLLLLDIAHRKFVIFGQVFWPQDFHLFVLGMIATLVFIILFTVVFGRIFCGWICPQTIFMEGVFRKIEYWIEGDYMAKKKLDNQAWNREKILKKSAKHTLFLLVSVMIMHTLLAYFMGVEPLWEMVSQGPGANPVGFSFMVLFTGLFYGVFNWMREQVCTAICPYGRLQGALLDRQSVVVAYDHVRGEERAKFRKKEDRAALGKGDCIDCNQCVLVCPTGIDIRNGTQLECINCTACIDACDSIMDRIGKPKGLVRYASEQNIADKKPFIFTTRMKAYSTVLSMLVGLLVVLLVIRTDFETTILRAQGMLYQEREDGTVSNLYSFKMINKTNEEYNLRLELIEPDGRISMVGNDISLDEQGIGEGSFFVMIHPDDLASVSENITIGIFSDDELIQTKETNFLGPMN